jgi:hypothetical protein
VLEGIFGACRTPWGGNTGGNSRRAGLNMAAPMRATSTPGVYVRGSRWVAVYRQDGRQRKESAATFRAAREIKIRRAAEEAARVAVWLNQPKSRPTRGGLEKR